MNEPQIMYLAGVMTNVSILAWVLSGLLFLIGVGLTICLIDELDTCYEEESLKVKAIKRYIKITVICFISSIFLIIVPPSRESVLSLLPKTAQCLQEDL